MKQNSCWEPNVDPELDPYGTHCAHERELQSHFVIEHGRDWSSPACAFAYQAWRGQCAKRQMLISNGRNNQGRGNIHECIATAQAAH
jgi:uncharacterized protein involved in copper resistance